MLVVLVLMGVAGSWRTTHLPSHTVTPSMEEPNDPPGVKPQCLPLLRFLLGGKACIHTSQNAVQRWVVVVCENKRSGNKPISRNRMQSPHSQISLGTEVACQHLPPAIKGGFRGGYSPGRVLILLPVYTASTHVGVVIELWVLSAPCTCTSTSG
jgi:hypothetical protein